MKLIKMTSPNGQSEIEAHPDRVQNLIDNGWKESAKAKPAKAEKREGK
jgi:hypothetical protein